MHKTGFTLIEIVVALFILSILIGVGIPRLNRAGATPLDTFLVQLNTLVQDAAQRSVSQGISYKILINFKARPPRVEIRIPSSSGTVETGERVLKSIAIPLTLSIEELYINSKVEPGRDEAWFFVTPDGVSQEVIINIIDSQKKESSLSLGNHALVLNPFTSQFKLYDLFQKP